MARGDLQDSVSKSENLSPAACAGVTCSYGIGVESERAKLKLLTPHTPGKRSI
jgi:hypothetical protein